MTLNEIETLIIELQKQVAANTAAIVTLNNTVSNYATTDDLSAIAKQVNTLNNNNTTLQNAVAALDESVSKIDHLQSLLDVEIDTITVNDILQYSNDGKWHNVSPKVIDFGIQTGPNTVGALKDLSDVNITNLTNGQSLIYNGTSGKWVNGIGSGSGSGSIDLSAYLTIADANATYLKLIGGTISGELTVQGLTTLGDNLLVAKGITMYKS